MLLSPRGYTNETRSQTRQVRICTHSCGHAHTQTFTRLHPRTGAGAACQQKEQCSRAKGGVLWYRHQCGSPDLCLCRSVPRSCLPACLHHPQSRDSLTHLSQRPQCRANHSRAVRLIWNQHGQRVSDIMLKSIGQIVSGTAKEERGGEGCLRS